MKKLERKLGRKMMKGNVKVYWEISGTRMTELDSTSRCCCLLVAIIFLFAIFFNLVSFFLIT